MESRKIGFVGGGNMAYAIAKGLASNFEASDMIASARTETRLQTVWKDLGTRTSTKNTDVVDFADVIFLCVKPHILPSVLQQLKSHMSTMPIEVVKKKLFVSVAAGVTLEFMEEYLQKCKVVRTMPNTPCLVNCGVVVFSCGKLCTGEDKSIIRTLFECIALVEEVDESQIDALSSIMGCSIAWFQMVIDGMSDGAVKNGVPRALSYKLISKSMEGAATMVLKTGEAPGVLKDQVTSPSGSTIHGLYELEQGGVRGMFMRAVDAATKRNAELGKQ